MTPPAGVALHTFRSVGSAAFIMSPDLWRWLRANGQHYDVVHVHGLLNLVSSMAATICILRKWPLVIRPVGTLSEFTFRHRRRALKLAYFRMLDGRNLARANAVHFTTDAERHNAESLGVALGERAHVVPPPWVWPPRPSARTREAAPTVLFVGRLHPVKAIEQLLAAWSRVLVQVPAARLVIAGDGDPAYVSRLRQLAANSVSGHSIHFAGFVAGVEKQRLFDQASTFVLPSHHENFGVAALEAIANGLPIVVSADVQLAPFISEHGLGIVAEREPDALAAALVATLTDAPLQEHCRKCGAEIVKQHFSTVAIGSQLMSVYAAAIATRVVSN